MKRMKKMFCALLAMVMVAGVCVIPAEARSDDDKVQALQALIDNAEEGAVITLEENYQWSDGEPIEIPTGKNIILNLDGHTLESLDMFPVITVMSGAELEIRDWSLGSTGSIINTAFEGWEQYYEEEWVGLFEVQENAKIRFNSGHYVTGSKMFTSGSTGEVEIGDCFFNQKPNIEYSVTGYNYLKEGMLNGEKGWYTSFGAVHEFTKEGGYTAAANQEIIFHAKITNYASIEIKNLYYAVKYSLHADTWYETEKECDISFTEVVAGEGYVQRGEEAYIDSIAPGETIDIVFKGKLPENVVGDIAFLLHYKMMLEEVEGLYGYDGRTVIHGRVFNVTTDIPDSVPKEEISQPVKDVTVVENKETESVVTKETVNVITSIMNDTVGEDVVSAETAMRVSFAINTGKSVKAEIVVKEMSTEEIEQITDTDKKAIEDKVATELGEDANLQYLDLSIMLKADDEELGTLNKLQEEITITVAIPEELKADGRTYKVIRNHNGVVEVLDTVVNEDGTISFKTDRFSTYAIAYADKEETNTNPNPGTPSTDNNKDTNTNQVVKPTTPSTDTKAPQTGDKNSVVVYVVIGLVALAAVVVTKKRNVFAK